MKLVLMFLTLTVTINLPVLITLALADYTLFLVAQPMGQMHLLPAHLILPAKIPAGEPLLLWRKLLALHRVRAEMLDYVGSVPAVVNASRV